MRSIEEEFRRYRIVRLLEVVLSENEKFVDVYYVEVNYSKIFVNCIVRDRIR